ncbi:RDD family protein [Nocardioides sp.]|uniref:RDD family protein n=1 Tax=Nocardioides sp. TaxID=35761 RepID=UPI00321B5EC4
MSATSQVATPVTYPAAELDRRFYAFVLDRLLAWGLFAGAGYLAWRFLIDADRAPAGAAAIVGTVLLVSLVYGVLLGVAGVSPGKALVGLRVVGYDDGRPIGVPQALLRTAVLGIFTLPTAGLGLATLAWTAVMDPEGRRRGGHDRMSNAVVVDVRPVPEVDLDSDRRPRQIVNLTAMRLMPTPSAEPVPAPGPPAAPRTSQTARPGAAAPAAQPRTDPRRPAPAVPTGPPPSGPPPASRPGRAPASQPVGPAAPAAARPTGPPQGPVGRSPEGPAGSSPGAPRDDAPTSRRAAPGRPTAQPEAVATAGRWRVAFDTGEEFVVEGLALVGRRPEPRGDEPVRHVVPLRSSDMSVSKTHAQFQVVPDGALVVMDRGSTNGSVLVRQGVSRPLTAGRPATLVDGDTVRFGDRTMTVSRESEEQS